MSRKGKKRLTVDIPEGMYEKFKVISKRRNISLSTYILQYIYQLIKKEEEYE